MKNLSRDEFKQLKDRLYDAKHGVELIVRDWPDIASESVTLEDGQCLSLLEILSALETLRSDCWKFGPPDVQRRHIQDLVKGAGWGGPLDAATG